MIAAVLPLSAGEIQISQADTGRLLFKGEIDIYFSLTGTGEEEVSAEDFSVSDKSTGALEIIDLKKGPNKEAGIDFILLLDNSGSMYEESYQGSLRITQAKLALNSFLDQIEESGDRAALYAFNTSIEELAPFGTPIPKIRRSLSDLKQPASEEAYTELYNSLTEVSKSFPRSTGRRAVIVLSDGENYSLFSHGGKVSARWGTAVATPDEIVTTFLQTGITIDGINISDSMDQNLNSICAESGGKFHNVRSTSEISGVYTDIREKITNEYMLRVKAPPLENNIGEISLEYKDSSDNRLLLVPVLFGASSLLLPLVLLFLIAGIGGIAALYFIPFEKPVKNAQIQSLDSNQKTILNSDTTVIGASAEAHHTIAGNPGIDAQHATIMQDEKTGEFTIVSRKSVWVNNRKVKNRALTPGDVIRIEGSTIIFDAPETTQLK